MRITALLVGSFAAMSVARSAVLIVVDASVPTKVSFTSTEGLSSATVSGANLPGTGGFHLRLENFYTSTRQILSTTFGDLRPSGGSPYNDSFSRDNALCIYGYSGHVSSFTQGQRAFEGSCFINATLPGTINNTSGTYDIRLVNNSLVNDPGVVIGQYYMAPVPEPASLLALTLGVATTVGKRRTSRRADAGS